MNQQAIANRIIELKNADLELRRKLIENGQLGEGYSEAMASIHDKNAAALNEIIEAIGYPTVEKVGKAGGEAAWLVIQHSIGQPGFMRKCLTLLAAAVREKKADPMHLAYLTDRVAVLSGHPQLYGTQFDWDESGALSPNPFDDLGKVNQRRKAIGLNTLEAQTAIMRRQAKNENHLPPPDLSQRNQEMEAWRERVGWVILDGL